MPINKQTKDNSVYSFISVYYSISENIIICHKIIHLKLLIMEQKKDFIQNNYNELFLKACELGILDVIEFMLKTGKVDINYEGQYRQTALYLAVVNQQTAVAQKLLACKGLKINTYCSPLHKAIELGMDIIVKEMIAYPEADINFRNQFNQTPLYTAVSYKRYEIADFLLSQPETDVISLMYIRTTLHEALLVNSDLQMAKKLLYARDINYFCEMPEGMECALKALELGDEDLFLHILSIPKIKINHRLLFNLLQEDKIQILELIVELPQVDINHRTVDHDTLLVMAIKLGKTDFAEKLLARPDLNVNQKTFNETPLSIAAQTGNIDFINKLLCLKEIDVNTCSLAGDCALLSAAGFPEIVKRLLAHPDINIAITDKKGNTALHKAVKANSLETAKLLIEHGGLDINAVNRDASCFLTEKSRKDLTAEDKSYITIHGLTRLDGHVIGYDNFSKLGVTALEMAIAYNHVEIAAFLLSLPKIDCNRKNLLQPTAFLLSIALRRDKITQLMLQRTDIDVNGSGNIYDTPLKLCIKNQQLEVFKKLLEHPRINVNIKDDDGETPLCEIMNRQPFSSREEYYAFIELLLQRPETDINAKVTVLTRQMTILDFIVQSADSMPQELLLLFKYRKEEVLSKLYNSKNKEARALLNM